MDTVYEKWKIRGRLNSSFTTIFNPNSVFFFFLLRPRNAKVARPPGSSSPPFLIPVLPSLSQGSLLTVFTHFPLQVETIKYCFICMCS